MFAAYLRGRDSSGWPVLQPPPPPSPSPTRSYTVDGSIIPKIRGTARRYTDNEDPPPVARQPAEISPPPSTPSFKSGNASNPLGNATSFYYEIILPELFSKYKPRDGREPSKKPASSVAPTFAYISNLRTMVENESKFLVPILCI